MLSGCSVLLSVESAVIILNGEWRAERAESSREEQRAAESSIEH